MIMALLMAASRAGQRLCTGQPVPLVLTVSTLHTVCACVCRSQAALQKAVASAAQNTRSRQGSTTAGAPGGHGNSDDIFAPRDGSRSRASSRWQQRQQAAVASSKRCTSLFGFLNYTSTSCGARLLRTNLLQPLTNISTLQLRLDSLQVQLSQGRGCRCRAAGFSMPWTQRTASS